MNFIARHLIALSFVVFLPGLAQAQGAEDQVLLQELDFNIDLSSADIVLAANSSKSAYRTVVPNVPDSAFRKPSITENNIHEYLGLASLAMGGLAALTVPETYDPDLLNSVHYKAAKLSWQLGAAAVASGLYAHWDDFYLEDGLLDRDNLHALLGLVGTLGYYLAVSSAVDEYNNSVGRYPSTSHAKYGIGGGASMFLAIGLTW